MESREDDRKLVERAGGLAVEKSLTPSRSTRAGTIVRLIGLHHVLYIMVVSKMRFNDI